MGDVLNYKMKTCVIASFNDHECGNMHGILTFIGLFLGGRPTLLTGGLKGLAMGPGSGRFFGLPKIICRVTPRPAPAGRTGMPGFTFCIIFIVSFFGDSTWKNIITFILLLLILFLDTSPAMCIGDIGKHNTRGRNLWPLSVELEPGRYTFF